jgi:hypothetical protein
MEGDIFLMPPGEKYLTSIYFTVTTITTVGYGDVSISTKTEKIFCIFSMLVGVISFSFASGSLASILQSIDNQNQKHKDQLEILNKLYKEYSLPLSLYSHLKQSLSYQAENDLNDIHQFTDALPNKLKTELSVYLYKDLFNTIYLLRHKSSSFLAWICPLFKPLVIDEGKYTYFEGDHVDCIHFIMKGECFMVLPKHDNTKYVKIGVGDVMGVTDIIGSAIKSQDFELEDWFSKKD